MNNIKFIELSKGQNAIVDTEDFERLVFLKWHAIKPKKKFYAASSHGKRYVYMHRLIINAPINMLVDHMNGNGLDNRKSNLRLCTVNENNYGYKLKRINASSRFRGVSKDSSRGKWQSHISFNRKSIGLGRFYSEIEAAKAYNRKASELFGKWANLNPV